MPTTPEAQTPPPAAQQDAADGGATLPAIHGALDPGIAAAVELLRLEGLSTTDSGDGYSKKEAIEAGEALDYAHVFIQVDQGFSAAEVAHIARTIPWTDYGYQHPMVEVLERAPESAADEPEIVGVIWDSGELCIQSPAVDAVEPSAADVDDAPLFVGGTDSAPMQQRREAVIARLLALGAEEQPGRHPTARVFALKYEAYIVPDVSYSAKDMDAAMQSVERACDRLESFMAGRWSQKHTAPVQPMSPDLAALAARGQTVELVHPSDHPTTDGLLSAILGGKPTAPGPTLAEVQAQLERERERADRAELDAVQERARAEAAEEQLAAIARILGPDDPPAVDVDGDPVSLPSRVRMALAAREERADEAKAELAAIAALLDPEDAPAYDSDDQPIPLPVRVQTALMPDPICKSELERRITKALDRYDAPKGFGSLGQASPYGRVLLTARENKQLKADKAALQGIIDAAEWIVHHCGSYGSTASLADRVLRLLPVERQRAILELKRSEAYIEVARINARFLNPPPPGRLEECTAKMAEIEAKIAALDAGEVQE